MSIEAQIQELRDFARQNNLFVVREFTESRTAKEPGRPIFNQMLLEIENAISKGSPADLEMAAHNIKGAVSHFYAEPSKLLAWQLEQIGKGTNLEGSERIFLDLKDELSRLQKALLNGVKRKKSA